MKKTLLVTAIAACAAFSTGAQADFSCSSVTGKLDCMKDYGPAYKPMYWQCLLLKGSIGGICQVIKLQVGQAEADKLNTACDSTDSTGCVTEMDNMIAKLVTNIDKKDSDIEKDLEGEVNKAFPSKK